MKTKVQNVDVKKAAANDKDVPEIDNHEILIADATKKVDDLKAQLTVAKDELRKLTGKKSSESKAPGVILSILSLVADAPKTGISKADILAKLVEMFPDRSKEGMEKTINVQLPSRMSKERNIKISKLESGNYYVAQ